MNCKAALGSRTPFASPYGEQLDGITLVWIPWLGGTCQGACLRCLHQGTMRLWVEVLARGTRWTPASSSYSAIKIQEYETKRLESELILCCQQQQPHPPASACHALSPSLCLSITHPIKIKPDQCLSITHPIKIQLVRGDSARQRRVRRGLPKNQSSRATNTK